MNLWLEIFRSVGDVWVVWLVCFAILAWTLGRIVRRMSFQSLKRALLDERGATYTLPYMLTFPIYLLVMCFMIQSTMILMVKMFSMQAASATVRSSVVWRSAHPTDHKDGGNMAVKHAHYAAALAMTPVASSQQRHLKNPLLAGNIFNKGTGLNWFLLREKIYRETRHDYQVAYRDIAADNIKRDRTRPSRFIRSPDEITPNSYLDKKLKYASWATRVEVDTARKYNKWNKEFTIELTYLMPMNIPGAGRLLGQFHQRGNYHSRLIVTKASMPMETPKTKDGHIGIGYNPALLR